MKNKLPEKNGMELVIYQIGELKNIIENSILKNDSFQEKIDKRVSALELWQAGLVSRDQTEATIFGTLPVSRIASILVATILGALVTYFFKSGGIK